LYSSSVLRVNGLQQRALALRSFTDIDHENVKFTQQYRCLSTAWSPSGVDFDEKYVQVFQTKRRCLVTVSRNSKSPSRCR